MIKCILRFAFREQYDDPGYYEVVPLGTPAASEPEGEGFEIELPEGEANALIEASTVMRESQERLKKLASAAGYWPFHSEL